MTILPDDRWLMGMSIVHWHCPPIWYYLAPKIFTAIVDAAEWIIRQERVKFVIHYLDDFLVIGGPLHPSVQ